MPPDLSIIILSWNTCALLCDCLASVFAEPTGLRLEVFVADNASSDGSVEMMRVEFPQVQVIENRENVGFARANNQVFPLCTSDLVMLLNSDTILKADALRVLVEFMRANPKAGAAGPKLLHPRLQLRVLGCGSQPTLWRTFTHAFFLSSLFPHLRMFEGLYYFVGIHDDRVREVGWVSGACLLVRQVVIAEAGPMTEEWFMYVEDHEWCARITSAGWAVYHVPEAVVEHHLSASTEKNADVSLMPLTAGREYYARQAHPSAGQLFLFDVIRWAGYELRAVGYGLLSLRDRGDRDMWRGRRQTFLTYARAARPSWKGKRGWL